ncbi:MULTISPECIES: DNA repair protein RadA [unclassified Granulicatella]|uniref:DNA repair protein RadA n=1 Tax=unclassified Granulicatella TaxID=2630493 RepID=UPI00107454B3|nr:MULTISPECIES: DNA repair protein RadA [unclassified Granulicatella]MBF0780453.1 DNA repair protein RadA [Granulicatella sp. 19428wC4_WM01]TFU95397.1 DNA repair protein RadA [Granulicatella sp. WM01]
MGKKITTKYSCQACGYESNKWLGRCPNCQSWSTLEEVTVQTKEKPTTQRKDFSGQLAKALPIKDITYTKEERLQTHLSELDRVLGGGIVSGSLVLIGGDPGIGKSTLLLQVSAQLHQLKKKVLYVSGEESASQIKMRAERLGIRDGEFYIYPETNMLAIIQVIEEIKPQYVIIDSIQTMVHEQASSGVAGSVSQIRENTATLMQLAKTNNIAIFIVGHVTKEGTIAGPRMLEHMVDTVLYFEGEKHQSFRILRAVKNRFGSTNEIGVFEMNQTGLREITNPSEFFLEERIPGANGSAVVVSVEGTRPILVEIQCLMTPTAFGNARRTASGLDYNRVALIMAVLEKRTGMLLQNQDAYFKVAGGVKLEEPAIDLAMAVSLASSYWEKETSLSDAFVGEIGLTGEIRRVQNIEDRIKEAYKLGFKRIFIPKNNVKGMTSFKGIEVIGVSTLKDALQLIFK